MNSLALLMILIIGGSAVLTSYVVSWRVLKPENRSALLGEMTGCRACLLVASPMVATVAFSYSAVFFLAPLLFRPSESTILGLEWGSGGEALLCILYAALLTFAAFW
jgi:hypothetical protein